MKETQQMSVAGAYEHKLSHAQQLLTSASSSMIISALAQTMPDTTRHSLFHIGFLQQFVARVEIEEVS